MQALILCGGRDMLPELGPRGVLFVYRHESFCKSMDTTKDVMELDQLAQRKDPPWLPKQS